jgi:invasion protein IalB
MMVNTETIKKLKTGEKLVIDITDSVEKLISLRPETGGIEDANQRDELVQS